MIGLKHKINSGENGRYVFKGITVFVTTAATVELGIPFQTIEAFSLSYCGAPAASESPLSINETINTDTSTGLSNIVRDSSGNVTVTRPAGTSSGIGFSFVIWGK
jgi:hypothetical protein